MQHTLLVLGRVAGVAGVMRIVLDGRIVIPRMTGAGRYVVELAQRVPGLANDLTLDVLLLPAMQATLIPGMLADAGVRVHYVNARVASLRQWLVVPFALARLRPDLYHYPFMDMPLAGYPSVVTIYDLNATLHPEYFDHFRLLKRPIARRLIGSTLRRSRLVFAISDETRRLIQQHYPESAHKVRTIHLGVDPAAWADRTDGDAPTPGDRADPWRSRPYILYVGVDRPHKNLMRLVRAFAHFRSKHGWQAGTGPYLWLAGVGTGSPGLRAQISDLALSSDVCADAALAEAELRAAYRGASAAAYVSTSEGFGLPLLEAFAAGVPVVSGDASCLPEVGGDAAFYTNPHDELAMSDALSRVWHDEGLRRTMAERGRRRAAELSWDATVRATVRAYYEVLGGGRSDERLLGEP